MFVVKTVQQRKHVVHHEDSVIISIQNPLVAVDTCCHSYNLFKLEPAWEAAKSMDDLLLYRSQKNAR